MVTSNSLSAISLTRYVRRRREKSQTWATLICLRYQEYGHAAHRQTSEIDGLSCCGRVEKAVRLGRTYPFFCVCLSGGQIRSATMPGQMGNASRLLPKSNRFASAGN